MAVVQQDFNLRYKPLAPEDISNYRVDPRLIQHIENCRLQRGLAKEDFKILDYGAGKGRLVAALRRFGYQAYGLEIDCRWVELATSAFQKHGLSAESLIDCKMDSTDRSGYPDSFFHFVHSRSVLEHVHDLDTCLTELNRIGMPNCSGYHQFVARWTIREEHLNIPLVHWFSNDKIRRIIILAALRVGTKTGWSFPDTSTIENQVDSYLNFMRREVLYRSKSDYINAFCRNGLRVTLDILDNPKLADSVPAFMLKLKITRYLIEFMCTNFKTIAFTTQRST